MMGYVHASEISTPARPSPQKPRPTAPLPGWPFWLPMAAFLTFIWLGGLDERLNPLSYVLRTVVVGGMLVWLWPRLKIDVEWTHLGLGMVVGVVGVVQWIGMDKFLLHLPGWLGLADDSIGAKIIGFTSFAGPGDGWNPLEHVPGLWLIPFLAIRFLGPVLVVPVMEELFWRNWLWRSFAAPNNWRLAKVGEYDHLAFWGTSVAFAAVHPQWLISIAWALLVAWLVVRTKSLGAAIVAHAVTNLLLGIYVLVMTLVLGYESEWYFW